MKNAIIDVRVFLLALLFLCGSVFTACDDDDDNPTNSSKAGTFTGQAINLGNGTAHTWVTLDDDGNPIAIGMTVSKDALENLPADAANFVLTFPDEASATVFDHMYFNWNPHGHPPPGIYDAQHFDFHFYLTSVAEREAITADASDADKMSNLPAEEFRPTGFRPDQNPQTQEYIGIPAMGLHWTDPTSPEWNGQDFTETFIWGSYDGVFTFLEPMCTIAFLQGNPNHSEDLKLPQQYQFSGYYPTTYSITTDAETGDYVVTLGGMVMR